MNRMKPKFNLLVATLLLGTGLVALRPAAGDPVLPGDVCGETKAKAAAKLYTSIVICHIKRAKNPSFDLTTCILTANGKLFTKFSKAEAKSASLGDDCTALDTSFHLLGLFTLQDFADYVRDSVQDDLLDYLSNGAGATGFDQANDPCEIAKAKAGRKAATAIIKCEIKYLNNWYKTGGNPTFSDFDCQGVVKNNMAIAFSKAETKAAGACPTVGDANDVWNGTVYPNVNCIPKFLNVTYQNDDNCPG